MIEDLPKRVIAAIHGTALGGGLELALGLPLSDQRSDRQLRSSRGEARAFTRRRRNPTSHEAYCAELALDMMTTGALVDASKARELGIVDQVLGGEALREEAIATALALEDIHVPIRRTREVATHINAGRDKPELFENFLEGKCPQVSRNDCP